MDLPRVSPVGLLETPPDFQPPPRRYPAWQRWLVLTVVVLFGATSLLTTVASLGRYCLTTHGGDTRELAGSPLAGSTPDR